MEEQDKITLICTSHNPDEKLLNRMLASAWQFDEIVLNVDQEALDSKHLCFCPNKQIARVINRDHWSIPEAYNWMIERVETEWVCCMPDDDFFYSDGLMKMIKEVHEGITAGVAHFRFKVSGFMPKQDLRGRVLKVTTGKSDYELCEKRPITPSLLKKHGRLPACSFFRKEAWRLAGGFSGEFEHDRTLWLKMAEAGVEFKYFDYLVYNYERRENSAWIKQRKDAHGRG